MFFEPIRYHCQRNFLKIVYFRGYSISGPLMGIPGKTSIEVILKKVSPIYFQELTYPAEGILDYFWNVFLVRMDIFLWNIQYKFFVRCFLRDSHILFYLKWDIPCHWSKGNNITFSIKIRMYNCFKVKCFQSITGGKAEDSDLLWNDRFLKIAYCDLGGFFW